MKIGINASDLLVHPHLGMVATAATDAEQHGFDSFWLAQTSLLDAQTALAIVGERTRSIHLGTAVVPTWTQHPYAMAAAALATQEASDGRFTLGIGLSHQPVVEDRYKMEWRRPVRHMLDYLDVLLPLLAEGRAEHEGEFYSYVGDSPRPKVDSPRVMLAALGEQMLTIAGRRTDGTILWCVGPTTIEQQIKPIIDGAAADAGRPTPGIVCSLPVWVTDNPEPAREQIGSVFAAYGELPSYRAMLDIEGAEGMADIALVGDHDEVVAGLRRIEAAGATEFSALVMGAGPEEVAATRDALRAVKPAD